MISFLLECTKDTKKPRKVFFLHPSSFTDLKNQWVLNSIWSVWKKLQDIMDSANRCEKPSVTPSFISSDMNLAKSMIDVMVFKNMEKIVDRMQDAVNGVPLRRDITLEYVHPSVFTGADLVNWIRYNTEIATTENALYMANLLFSHGFFFSISRQQIMVTNDEHCYRFQKIFKKNTSDEHKELYSTHNELFFRQPRYQIECNRFEFLDIPTDHQEKNQPICSLANSPSSMMFEEPSIQTNNSNNTTNNNNNVNNFTTNNERKVSVGGSRVAEKPPEILIRGVKSEPFEQMLIENLRKLSGPNNLDFIASFNHLKIHTTQPETYRKTIRYLDDHKVLYDTSYKSCGNTVKSFRVILRNVPPTTSVRKIKKELETLGFSVRQVLNMKHKKTNVSLPLFTVDLEPSEKNEEIFFVDTFLNIDVEFEEPYKESAVEQCKNCQDFGHMWPDCVFQSRCVRCGKNHASSECNKSKDTPATCALCQGDHPANYKGCRVYKTFRHLRRQIPDEVIQSAPQVPMHSESQVPAHSAPLVSAHSAASQEASNYWVSNTPKLGDYEYAVYLCKKHMEVKDLSDMADYEMERLEHFKKMYCNKWVYIKLQAETEIKMVHQEYDSYEKEVMDTQEHAFWDLHRPMPPCISLKVPLDYEKLLMFKELTDWDKDKIIDAYIQDTHNL